MRKQIIKGNIYFYYSRNKEVKRFPTGIKAADRSSTGKRKVLAVENKLRNIIDEFSIKNGYNPPTSYVVEEYDKNIPKRETLLEHFEGFLILKRADPDIKPQSLKPYDTTRRNLEDFTSEKKKNSLVDLELKFILDFHTYLKEDLKLGLETQKKRVNILKEFLKYLRDNDIFECKQSLFNHKVSLKKASLDDEIYTISKEKLTELYEFNFTEKIGRDDFDYVKDMVIFEAMTSIRIGDILRLTQKNINGREIKLVSQKSGKYVVNMNDTAFEIWNRYKGFNRYIATQTIFGKLRDLLEFCKLFDDEITINGVKKLEREFITTHTFRKTFITLMVMQNTPLNKLMAMTAHQKIDTLLVYINKYAPAEVEYENQIAL